jgi:hypothetical protein
MPGDLSRIERELLGRSGDTYAVDRLAQLAGSIDAAQYYSERMLNARRCADKSEYIRLAIEICTIDGMTLEFGVHTGGTINHIASMVSGPVYGFDTFFTGIPEAWQDIAPAGYFSLKELPQVRENVSLVVGLFEDTLPSFVDNHKGPIRLLHVDCDLYSSTRTIFRGIGHKIIPGTVIMFDEYFNYPGWRLHEYRAFQEFIAWSGLRYEYLSVVPTHQQVAIVIR